MNYNLFKNLSCYEEFEIQCALAGISKIDILKMYTYTIDNYYFFISKDGVFNWFDLEGNYVKDPCVLKDLTYTHIPIDIIKCIIPNSVINIGREAFSFCELLTSINIPDNVTSIGKEAFAYCISLKEIIIPDSIEYIDRTAFARCGSLKEVIFKGKTLDEVKQMNNYPFGIEDESIIKCELC